MISIKRAMGTKGQIVIPRDIREQFNLKQGSYLVFNVEDNAIILQPSRDPAALVEEFCKAPSHKQDINAKDIKEIIEEQYKDKSRTWLKK